jgi:uncharacterized membrane protein
MQRAIAQQCVGITVTNCIVSQLHDKVTLFYIHKSVAVQHVDGLTRFSKKRLWFSQITTIHRISLKGLSNTTIISVRTTSFLTQPVMGIALLFTFTFCLSEFKVCKNTFTFFSPVKLWLSLVRQHFLQHTPNNSVIPSQTRAGWMLRLTQNWYVIFTISSLVFPTRM